MFQSTSQNNIDMFIRNEYLYLFSTLCPTPHICINPFSPCKTPKPFLQRHEIDFIQITAGKWKRTVDPFAEVTAEAREKAQEEPWSHVLGHPVWLKRLVVGSQGSFQAVWGSCMVKMTMIFWKTPKNPSKNGAKKCHPIEIGLGIQELGLEDLKDISRSFKTLYLIWFLPSLKLTVLKIGWAPKGIVVFPTIHFQVRNVSFREVIHYTPPIFPLKQFAAKSTPRRW